MEKLFNIRLIRIVIGLVIGIPLTAVALVTGVHGLILGYGGVINGDILLFSIGIITILGFIGISRAWRRILKPTDIMTNKERHVVRAMLQCGVASSLTLSIWTYFIEQMFEVPVMLAVLSVGGVAFVRSTPR